MRMMLPWWSVLVQSCYGAHIAMNYGMHVVLVTCFVHVCESLGQGGLHSYPGQYRGSSVLHRERVNRVILYTLLGTIFINLVECVFFGKFNIFGLCQLAV